MLSPLTLILITLAQYTFNGYLETNIHAQRHLNSTTVKSLLKDLSVYGTVGLTGRRTIDMLEYRSDPKSYNANIYEYGRLDFLKGIQFKKKFGNTYDTSN